MTWAAAVVGALKAHEVRLLAYLPDSTIQPVLAAARGEAGFEMVPLSREEEGIGVAVGGYLGRLRGAVLLQNSGLGNCVNALASLAVPMQVPFLLLIGMRGEEGEFNVSQVGMGQATRAILDALGVPHLTLRYEDEVDALTRDAATLAFKTRTPVALLLSRQLTGGKNE
jgi:sulfopyruvate decarboxylase alpha subunit